jgi:O-antigen/teichoic acid export membrane protein
MTADTNARQVACHDPEPTCPSTADDARDQLLKAGDMTAPLPMRADPSVEDAEALTSVIHRSMFLSALTRYGDILCSFATTFVLARLLSPEDFGTFAVIGALVAVVAASYGEFGGSNYLVSKTDLTPEGIRAAFTVTLVLSVGFAAGLAGLGGVMAWFFSQPALDEGIKVFAWGLLTMPFVSTTTALLRRNMRFGLIARCNLTASAVAAAVSISTALAGFRYMSLVFGALAGNLVLVGMLVFVFRGQLDIFRPSFRGYRDILSFGAFSAGTAIINVFYSMAPQLMLGRLIDFNAVGLYSRAVGIAQLFDKAVLNALTPVIMPAIFSKTRVGGDLKAIYLNSIALMTAVQWPFLLAIALLAEPLIRLWLGPQWMDTVPLVRLLCVASLSLFMAPLTYPVLVALGRVRDTLTSSLISLPPSILVIALASFHGVTAVAASALLTLPFQAAVALYFVGRHLGIGLADLLKAMTKSAVVTACCAAAIGASMGLARLGGWGPFTELLLAAGFGTAGWWLGAALTQHPLLVHVETAAGGLRRALPRLRWLQSR